MIYWFQTFLLNSTCATTLRAELREREADWSASQAIAVSASLDIEAGKRKTAALADREAKAQNDLLKLRNAQTKAADRSHEEMAECVVELEEDKARLAGEAAAARVAAVRGRLAAEVKAAAHEQRRRDAADRLRRAKEVRAHAASSSLEMPAEAASEVEELLLALEATHLGYCTASALPPLCSPNHAPRRRRWS